MAYTKNEKPSGLDTLTTLADDDVIIVGDTNDSSRVKTITKANLATDLSAVNASETVKGVVEEATDAQVLAGTATGETGAKLFVTPAKLATNLPSLSGGNLMFSAIADENLTIGTPVGVSNNKAGYVAQANRTDSSVTTTFTSTNNRIQPSGYCSIGTDKFVFIEGQTANDTLYATVGTVTPGTKTVALGDSVAVTADIQGLIFSINKLDTDRFIVFYQEDASATVIKYRIGTVATSTITFGDAATFATGASNVGYLTSEFLSTEKGVMVYKCATPTDSRAIVFTTAGDVASPGTPSALSTDIDSNANCKVCKISTDKFVIVNNASAVADCFAQVGTCTGTTTITLGTAIQYITVDTTTADPDFFDVCSPTTDTFILRYRNAGTASNMIAATVSGTAPTFGAELLSATNGNGGIYADSTSSVLVSDCTDSTLVRVTLSGTTLSNQGVVAKVVTANAVMRLCSLGTYYIGIGIGSTTFSSWVEGMSNGFIGVAQSTVSKDATVNVLYRGKDTNQTNLVPGGYYLASSGAFTLVASNVTVNTLDDCNIGKALSSSDILL